ncbi:Uncharacterised protein [Mycobacterium tuberculosis]|uniref:Uncharacterized protein n=1 Tax=Mycobacterium tuberculosis TaxID=1773 RepID=A0A916PAI1_MYCTX|nr:Uncharacterised protein [Mycobacterium tuberculosis]
MSNSRSAGLIRATLPETGSVLGEAVHPVREFPAFQVAGQLRALHTDEFAARETQEGRQMAVDQVP